MLLFDIGAILFAFGLLLYLLFRIFPPKYVQNLDDTQRVGCFGLLITLSIIGGLVMIIAHYFVAGIPEAIKLWQ
jgi:hypothetical protein